MVEANDFHLIFFWKIGCSLKTTSNVRIMSRGKRCLSLHLQQGGGVPLLWNLHGSDNDIPQANYDDSCANGSIKNHNQDNQLKNIPKRRMKARQIFFNYCCKFWFRYLYHKHAIVKKYLQKRPVLMKCVLWIQANKNTLF